MKLIRITAAVLALGFASGSAMAATLGFTEGNRDAVIGTTSIGGDASGGAPGFDLGAGNTLGLGGTEISQIGLHGRIVRQTDTYSFSSTSGFRISFNFNGYDTASGFVGDSGFTKVNSGGNTSLFSLIGATSESFSTNITGGDSLIFAGGPGDFLFSIDGSGSAALYDISIEAIGELSVVPLPASGLMLLGAMGGFAALRRRRKST